VLFVVHLQGCQGTLYRVLNTGTRSIKVFVDALQQYPQNCEKAAQIFYEFWIFHISGIFGVSPLPVQELPGGGCKRRLLSELKCVYGFSREKLQYRSTPSKRLSGRSPGWKMEADQNWVGTMYNSTFIFRRGQV